MWNWSKNVQISNRVDYRKTNYRSPLLDEQVASCIPSFSGSSRALQACVDGLAILDSTQRLQICKLLNRDGMRVL